MEHLFTYSVCIYIYIIYIINLNIYINIYRHVYLTIATLSSPKEISSPHPWPSRKISKKIKKKTTFKQSPTPLFSVPSDQWHVTSILFPSGWSFPRRHRYHPSKLSRASPCVFFGRQMGVSENNGIPKMDGL